MYIIKDNPISDTGIKVVSGVFGALVDSLTPKKKDERKPELPNRRTNVSGTEGAAGMSIPERTSFIRPSIPLNLSFGKLNMGSQPASPPKEEGRKLHLSIGSVDLPQRDLRNNDGFDMFSQLKRDGGRMRSHSGELKAASPKIIHAYIPKKGEDARLGEGSVAEVLVTNATTDPRTPLYKGGVNFKDVPPSIHARSLTVSELDSVIDEYNRMREYIILQNGEKPLMKDESNFFNRV